MGFTSGLTGGVVVTLGAAYLALRAHQHNRETQSEIVRAQTTMLDNTMPRATRRRFLNEQEYQRQVQQNLAESGRRREPHLVESAKERWNHEVEAFAHWLQHVDWVGTREVVEDSASRTFTQLGGDEVAARGKERASEVVGRAADEAKDTGNWLWARAEDAKERAKEAGQAAEKRALEAARSAEARASEAARVAQQKASEAAKMAQQRTSEAANAAQQRASETAHAVTDRAKETGWSLWGRARETVSSAVDTLSSAASTVAADAAITETPVQRALRQRYEGSSGLDKSVAQALEERYTASDQRGLR